MILQVLKFTRHLKICTKVNQKFKLPKIKLKKFKSNPKYFLSFWIKFQKIHDDIFIAEVFTKIIRTEIKN